MWLLMQLFPIGCQQVVLMFQLCSTFLPTSSHQRFMMYIHLKVTLKRYHVLQNSAHGKSQRKEAALKINEATFEKHEYETARKYKFGHIEPFDQRPDEMKGKASDYTSDLLKRLHGQQLCVSLMFEESFKDVTPPTKANMLTKVQALKRQKLGVSEEQIRKIELETRTRYKSSRWFDIISLRLTSSMFGHHEEGYKKVLLLIAWFCRSLV